MNIPSQVAPVLLDLPAFWREDVQHQLTSEENVLAWLEVDLDARLYFARGLLVLTRSRLIWCAIAQEKTWNSLDIQPDWRLVLSDHAGVGHLRLLSEGRQLADWRFTLGRNLQAAALLARFDKQQKRLDRLRALYPA
jgi:ATP-binding cassette subfamily B protein